MQNKMAEISYFSSKRFCVSIKFVSCVFNVPGSHETDVLYNDLNAPTFHNLFLNISAKKPI